MSFHPDHELHKRRMSRNLGLGGALLAFVVIVFAMTVVKVEHEPPEKRVQAPLSALQTPPEVTK